MSDGSTTAPATDPLNPFVQPGFHQNPFAEYARVRESDPLHYVQGLGWVSVAYQDCRELLKSDRTRQADPNEWQPDFGLDGIGELQGTVREWIGMSNEPDHKRRRALCERAFKRQTVRTMQRVIDDCVDEILTAGQSAGGMDLVAGLTYPLPANVICGLLGMPAEDRDLLRGWSHDVSVTYDPVLTADDMRKGITAAQQTQRYFQGLIRTRRREPQDDLLTAFAFAEENGHTLSPHEIAANALLVFLAGHETTTGVLGNGLLELYSARNAGQLALVRDQREAIFPATVEEMMRHSGSVHTIWRVANEDFERSGRIIGKDDLIVTVLAAANRDPDVYPDPDQFDVTRKAPVPHLGFGWGSHFCLGAHLARLEMESALRAVLDRLPGLRILDEHPEPGGHITNRGPKELLVEF